MALTFNSLTERVKQVLGGVQRQGVRTLSDIGSNLNWAGNQVQQNVVQPIQQAPAKIFSPQNINAFQRGVLAIPSGVQNAITNTAGGSGIPSFMAKKITRAGGELGKLLDQRQTPVLLSKQGLTQFGKAVGTALDPVTDIGFAPKVAPAVYAGSAILGGGLAGGSQLIQNLLNRPKDIGRDVLEQTKMGISQGIAQTPKIGAIASITNPAIMRVSNKFLQSLPVAITSKLSDRGVDVINRVIQGTLSIPEGKAIAKALGQEYTPLNAAIDFAVGAGLAYKIGKKAEGVVDKKGFGLSVKAVDEKSKIPMLPNETIGAYQKRLEASTKPLLTQFNDLVSSGNYKQAEDVLGQMKKQGGVYKEYIQPLEGILKPKKQVLDPLIQEAKKYKSAEEFVDFNSPTVYRGSTGRAIKSIPSEGLSVTKDFNIANQYAKARGLAGQKDMLYIKPNAKVITLDEIPNDVRGSGEGGDFAGRAAIWARKQGYDILDMSKGNEAEMRILNKEAIISKEQSKSQLTDIWNQANKGVDINKAIDIESSIRNNVSKIQQDFLDGKITIEQRKALADKEFARSIADKGVGSSRISAPVAKTNIEQPVSQVVQPLEGNIPQPQLQPNGEIKLLTAGKEFVARTPAEAKRYFRKTGVVPKMDFRIKSRRKTPIIVFGKSEFYNAEPRASLLQDDYRDWQTAVLRQANEAEMVQRKASTVKVNNAIDTLTGAIKQNTKPSYTKDITELKDISGFYAGLRDVYRNFKAVFGKKMPEVKKQLLDPFDSSKGNMMDELDAWAAKLNKEVEVDLGIRAGSRQSAAVQEFGEGSRDFASLVEEFGQGQANKIVRADKWFRENYNILLDELNVIRSRIYPNDPTKIIPKRQDYYRHFRDLSKGFQGLLNIFETPSNIASSLSGVSEYAKPRSKWLSFAQKRLGVKSDVDAVGGFVDYLKSWGYAKNIDPHISRFRALATQLMEQTAEDTPNAGKLNNFIEFLNDFANDLSGKTNPLDRAFQKWIPGGRKTFSVINWLNSRVKANVILGNLSSSVAQIFNVPQGIASAGVKYSAKGVGRTLASLFETNKPISQSSFIKERYFNSFDKFDRGMIDNAKKGAAWITSVLDEVGTKYIWNSHYEKALGEGIQNPIKYADDLTRQMVAGRGIGEVPLVQKSKVFQALAPFQLEVANLWHVLKDFVDEKAFGKIATLFVLNYLFNKGAESIRGSGVVLDPIQAMVDAFNTFNQEEEKGKGVLKAGGRLAGEVLGNIPFGQSIAASYPEYGFQIGDKKIPTREDLFGKGDPTRFGSGLVVTKGLQDPVFKILPPFGGQQIKRTIEGLKAVTQGYSESSNGKVQYPIAQTPINYLRGATFGKGSTAEGRDYLKNERAVLGDKQSAILKKSDDKMGVYNNMIGDRTIQSKESEIRDQVLKTGEEQTYNGKKFYLSSKFNSETGEREPTVKTVKVKQTPEEIYNELPKEYEKSEDSPNNLLEKIAVYGTGIFKDPEGTINAIKTGQPIRKVNGDAVIVERLKNLSKLDQGDKTTQVDHLIPLALGGDNSFANTNNIMTNEAHAEKTKLDKKLIQDLKDGKITKKEAQSQYKDFLTKYEDQITESPQKDEVLDILKKKYDPIYNSETQTYSDVQVEIPEYPKLTGLEELDKQLKSKYKSALSKAKTNIAKLYLDGQITAEEAESLFTYIKNEGEKASTKKPKKPPTITVKKLSVPRVPTIKLKRYNPKKINIKKKKLTLKSSSNTMRIKA